MVGNRSEKIKREKQEEIAPIGTDCGRKLEKIKLHLKEYFE